MAQHRSNKRHRLGVCVCVCSELSQTTSPRAVSSITLSAQERFPQFVICRRIPTCTHYVTLLRGPMVTCRPCWPNCISSTCKWRWNDKREEKQRRKHWHNSKSRKIIENSWMSNVNICLTLRSPANFKCVIQRVLHLKGGCTQKWKFRHNSLELEWFSVLCGTQNNTFWRITLFFYRYWKLTVYWQGEFRKWQKRVIEVP